MNETFFKDGFLTSTEAQNICNVAKEAVASEHEKLRAISFYNTEVASIVSPNAFIKAKEGNADIKWISSSLDRIGRYNALNAWLKEAIKTKEAQLHQIEMMEVSAYPEYVEYRKPEEPYEECDIQDEDIIKGWDKDRLNKYYSLNSRAAVIGSYIHDSGSIAVARKDLINRVSNPSIISGNGRETVVFRYHPSVAVDDVENMFMSLLAEHRNLNAQLNKMKAEAKEEANAKNIENKQNYRKAYTEYEQKLSEYYSAIKQQNTKFAEYVISEKEKISKLKINVPASLMDTYKEVKSLISE